MRPLYRYVLALVAINILAGATAAHSDTYNYTYVNVPGAYSTECIRINDAGQVVGDYYDASGRHGFVYSGGNFTTLDPPGSGGTTAWDVNMVGQVLGTYGSTIGFVYSVASGSYTILNPLPDFRSVGINDAGDIVGVGTYGFLYRGGNLTEMNFPGTVNNNTDPHDINNVGQIVGDYNINGATHGFLYRNGQYTTIDFPGATSRTSLFGINDAGQIVGIYDDNQGRHNFLLSGGVYTTLDIPGQIAYGINGPGQIVTYENFVANPVPLPGTLLLLGSGLLGLAGWRRLRQG